MINIMKMVCQMEESNPLTITLKNLEQNIIFTAEDKSKEIWIDSETQAIF